MPPMAIVQFARNRPYLRNSMPFQLAPIVGPMKEPSWAKPSASGVPKISSELVTTRIAGARAPRPFGRPDASINPPAATVIVP